MFELLALLQFGLCRKYISEIVKDRNTEIEYLHQYVWTNWVDISRSKKVGSLNTKNGTDRSSQNIGKKLPLFAAEEHNS